MSAVRKAVEIWRKCTAPGSDKFKKQRRYIAAAAAWGSEPAWPSREPLRYSIARSARVTTIGGSMQNHKNHTPLTSLNMWQSVHGTNSCKEVHMCPVMKLARHPWSL
eukprot:2357934-Amphidinium_carterae.3